MYMSYCRFEGTKMELDACLREVDDHVNGEAEYEVSEREIQQFRLMVHNFVDWMNDQCLLTEDGEVDKVMLETICEKMSQKCEEEVDEYED